MLSILAFFEILSVDSINFGIEQPMFKTSFGFDMYGTLIMTNLIVIFWSVMLFIKGGKVLKWFCGVIAMLMLTTLMWLVTFQLYPEWLDSKREKIAINNLVDIVNQGTTTISLNEALVLDAKHYCGAGYYQDYEYDGELTELGKELKDTFGTLDGVPGEGDEHKVHIFQTTDGEIFELNLDRVFYRFSQGFLDQKPDGNSMRSKIKQGYELDIKLPKPATCSNPNDVILTIHPE